MTLRRKSNIELLRIISVLLIICFHYVYKCDYNFSSLTLNSLIIKSFYFCGELGVNIFILIIGYFHIENKFSIKKLIVLLSETLFYCILNIIAFNTINMNKNISLMLLFHTLTQYWFIIAYILLYLLTPYLNILIKKLTKNEYKKLILLTVSLWSVIPTFFGLFYNSSETMLFYNRFIWFIIIYLIGSYIRIYNIKFLNTQKKNVIYIVSTTAVLLLSIIIISSHYSFFQKIGTTETAYLWTPNNIVMLLLSVSTFNFFKNLKIRYNSIINTFAKCTLGIYMIHDGLFQRFIWKIIFKSNVYVYTNKAIPYILISTIIIFIIGSLIDMIRQFIEKHTLLKILETNIFNKIIEKIKILTQKILDSF